MAAIVLEGISKFFGASAAVDNANLEVETGEFVTLLGPSGCGKTTTLRMVAGLEQNSTGRISIGGEVVSDAAQGFFIPPERRHLGMVFQSYAIWPHMTVFDNVAYPLRIRRKSAQEIKDRVTNALRLVEMDRFADRPAPALSGGQQQRVAIARALVFEPRVLLLDEPLSNLDARLRTQTGDDFRQLQKRLGITSLYVTHDQGEAMALSDRVVVMSMGKILQVGSPEDIYQKPKSRDVAAFFGSPNFIEAEVKDCRPEPDGTFLLTLDGGWKGPCHSSHEIKPGAKTAVMVRPENMRLVTGSHGPSVNGMAWHGTVKASIYRGAHRSVTLDTAAGRLNIDLTALENPKAGENVEVFAAENSAWAVPV